jgi:ELWxxDGT repeat protein
VRAFTSLSIGGTPITAVKGTGRAFFASGPLSTEGRELWMSDGTEMGTARVADIVTGPGSSNPTQIVSAGVGASGEPRVLFVAATAGEGAELWFSDGTPPPAGTRLVKDIRTGPTGSGISELVAVVSPAPGTSVRAYFVADDGTGERLWTSDGSEPGTHALLDINPAGADRVGNFAIARGRLYFTADDGVHGLELWTSDGTAMGTRMVADVWPGDRGGLEIIDPGNPTPGPSLTAVNNRLYFIGNDGTHGNELRVLDLCPADFNNDANVSVQDVFDFLGAYFTGNDRADVNGVGGVMVQDVFEFLAAWFGGC